jgi:hypothetical protein
MLADPSSWEGLGAHDATGPDRHQPPTVAPLFADTRRPPRWRRRSPAVGIARAARRRGAQGLAEASSGSSTSSCVAAPTGAPPSSPSAAASSAISPDSPPPAHMRGIGYVQVPTTLLAQVDSSVGARRRSTIALGKNMIGAFHQPRRVIADIGTLRTLPRREFVAGLAEVIKYGVIADEPSSPGSKRTSRRCSAATPPRSAMSSPARRGSRRRWCRRTSASAGARELLNYAHTFGHAIEAGLGFGAWLHGEAIGCGMVLAARDRVPPPA